MERPHGLEMEVEMSIARKSLTAALGAAVVAGGALVSTGAEAGHRHHHRDRSGAIVAGVIGGLAVGALAAAVASRPSRAYADTYHYPAGGYYPSSGYHPAYSGYVPATSWRDGHGYQPVRECYKERRQVYDRWGNYMGVQKVRVCR